MFVHGCVLFSLHGTVTFELAMCEMLDVVLLIFLSCASEVRLLTVSGSSKMCWSFDNEFLIDVSIAVV